MDEPFRIVVRDLKKTFGKTHALRGLSTDFSPGIMHGVIGPEGAGKTTLMRILMGLLKPTDGDVTYFAGNDQIRFEKMRSKIAYMPQQQSLYADLSIAEHLLFFKAMYRLGSSEYQQRSERLLHLTRLEPFIERPAGKLSGGMYKKLGVMCALLYSPNILILDEPTNGVDPVSRRELWELLYEFARQDMLILVSTSYMDEAERCAYVHLMNHGKLVAAGEPKLLLQERRVQTFDELFLTQEGIRGHG